MLTLVVVEMVFRLAAPQYHNFVQPDDTIGYSLVPGSRYLFFPPENCPGWRSSGTINTHGLRDRDYPYRKEPGTFRILALGDSYTEGLQFELDKTWTKLLEQRLNKDGSVVKYEVINAGRSGMGTGTEFLYYMNEGWKYNADLVLVLFIPNDVSDNSPELSHALQPYFHVSAGELVLDNSFSHSSSYRLRKVLNRLARASYLFEFARKMYAEREPRLRVVTQDRLPKEESAIEVTQALYRALSRAAVQHGSQFAVAIGTSHDESVWTDDNSKLNDLTSRANEVMAGFFEREQIHYVNLRPVLKAFSTEHAAIIHGCAENGRRGHWTEVAHTVAADALYKFLKPSQAVM
jgi:lysophospholipase L1-like esterase